jgi:hypothetical protein
MVSTLATMTEEAPRLSRCVLILIYVACALLFWGPIAAATAYFYSEEQQALPGIRAATEAYLTAVIDGDTGTAYDLLCEDNRREQPRATWQPISNDGHPPTGFRITDAGRPSVPGDGGIMPLAVTVELTYESAADREYRRRLADETGLVVPSSRREVTFHHLENEDGAWKVCDPPAL